MNRHCFTLTASAVLSCVIATAASAQNFIISSSLPMSHTWTGGHMTSFMQHLEKESGGAISFTPFIAGELTGVGRELDALQGGTVHIAAPLLSPYHEGAFPLSDVTQLPSYGTTSPMVTRAFQKLIDSTEVLKDGKTFAQLEIEPKNIRVWAVGATPGYAISTTGKAPQTPAEFKGMPLRAGSAIHTIALNEMGATPVTMPASQAYEALSRGTVKGLVLAIADWPAYSLESLLKDTISDVAIGHWESFLAISNDAWDQMDDAGKAAFDKAARQAADDNSALWVEKDTTAMQIASEKFGAGFTPITEMSKEMQDFIAGAAARTWTTWIDKNEAAGHPAKAVAVIYAKNIIAEGGRLPDGVAEKLGL